MKFKKKDRCERMKKLEQLYEGKAKKVFATEDPDVVIVDLSLIHISEPTRP